MDISSVFDSALAFNIHQFTQATGLPAEGYWAMIAGTIALLLSSVAL